MSDNDDWTEVLRQIEVEIGRSLTPSKSDSSLEATRPGWEKMLAEIEATPAAYCKNTVLDFLRKLMRQGTVIPDFDVLHQKKTELDRKLFAP